MLGVANFAMDRLSELFDDSPSDARIATRLDPAYLRWRYGQAPLLDYRVVTEETDGALAGAAFFRVRPRGRLWETTLGDVIVRPGDRRTARRLIGQVISAAKVDHVTCHFPTGSAQLAAARARGFLRWSRGEVFVVNASTQDSPRRWPRRTRGPSPRNAGGLLMSGRAIRADPVSPAVIVAVGLGVVAVFVIALLLMMQTTTYDYWERSSSFPS